MSAEESSLEDATPEEQDKYKRDLAAAAGLSSIDVEEGVPVWGVVRPAWRSAEVSCHVERCLGRLWIEH